MNKKAFVVMLVIAIAVIVVGCGWTAELDVTNDDGTVIQIGEGNHIRGTFVEIGGGLFYDPNTMIVWLRNGTSTTYESYIWVPYVGPNGLPYSWDVETGTFVQTHGE